MPPACARMKRIAGQRASVPLNNRLAAARVVSRANSKRNGGRLSFSPALIAGTVGCRKTTALRRLSSANNSSNAGSPGYVPSILESSITPSNLKVSRAYSSSRRAASISGRGNTAKAPNLTGYSCTRRAAYSLQRRARSRANARSPKYTPGSEREVIAVTMPWRSISSSVLLTSQVGKGRPPPPVMPSLARADTYSGGKTCWCTSILYGSVDIFHLLSCHKARLQRGGFISAARHFVSAPAPGPAYQASWQIWFHSIQRVDADLLPFTHNAVRVQRRPLAGSEVRGNLCLLNQVVRLSQPQGKVEQVRILGQLRHTIDMAQKLENSLLGAIAQEKLYATVPRPGCRKDR